MAFLSHNASAEEACATKSENDGVSSIVSETENEVGGDITDSNWQTIAETI
jgi:hypothetical protein